MPLPRALLLAGLATFTFASAANASTDGWDWDEELTEAEWTDDSLVWVSDIHPDHPTPTTIERRFDAPPPEPWCYSGPAPTAQDCAEHKALLQDWLTHDLRQTNTQATRAVRTYPSECWSACYP